MLATVTEFPQAGSAAFLRGSAESCRILQRRADGLFTIAIDDRYKSASSTRTAKLADLAATQEEALGLDKSKRRRGRSAGQ